MKKITLFFVLLISFNFITFSQDTTSAKYFPLKVGNKWIYNHYWMYSGNTKLVHTIIDTAIYNGHKYYKFRKQTPPPGSGYGESYIRIDSATGSIREYSNGCPWLNQEYSLDSLRGSYPDSAKYRCENYYRFRRDTSYIVLGQLRPIKGFNHSSYFEYSDFRAFAYGIGLIKNYTGGPPGSNYTLDLLGCFINGILYGDTSLTGITNISSEIPAEFSLSQNYPNPFNPSTKIKFQIPSSFFVAQTFLSVYDVLGKEIATLVNQQLQPGTYEVDWDASAYPSGVYFYTLRNSDFTETKKLILIK